MVLNFEKNILIRGKIRCLTGLHIGGVAETMEIGGTDNHVILVTGIISFQSLLLNHSIRR